MLEFLRTELAPSPARYRATLRIVIACLLATIVIMGLHVPEGHWIIITIFLVSQSNAGASIAKGVERIAGTLVGAAAGILITIAFPQEPWFKVTAFALVIGLGLFLGRTTSAPYASLLGSITVILVIGGVGTYPPADITQGLWRMLNICIGVSLGTGAQVFLWPDDPEEVLLREFTQTLADTDAQLARLLGDRVAPAPDLIQRLEQNAFTGLARHLDLLHHMETRYLSLKRRHSELLVAITAINRLASASASLAGLLPSGAALKPAPTSHLAERIAALRAECARLQSAIVQRRPPIGQLESGSAAFEEGATMLRPILLDIKRALQQLPASLSFLDTTAAQAAASPGLRSPLDTGAPDPFFTPRCSFSNTDDLRFAAKGTMAAMFCYVLTNLLDWTQGITAVVSCPIIAQSSVGATFQKALLRIAGATLGAVLALGSIMYAMPNMTSLPGLLAVVAACSFCAAYVTSGSTRIAYAGVQMGIGFALGILDTPSPTVDVLPPLSRILGIIVGDVVTATTFYYVWPVFAGTQMLTRLATALRHVAQLSQLGVPDLAGGTIVPPARGFRLQIFSDITSVLQLYNEAEFEPRTHPLADRRRRDQLLALLQTMQSIGLVVLAIVRHRVNAGFTEAEPASRQALRGFALAIAPALDAAADRLEGRPAPPLPDFDTLIADSAVAIDTAIAASENLPATEAAELRMRDQLQFYRALAPMLRTLEHDARVFCQTTDADDIGAAPIGASVRT